MEGLTFYKTDKEDGEVLKNPLIADEIKVISKSLYSIAMRKNCGGEDVLAYDYLLYCVCDGKFETIIEEDLIKGAFYGFYEIKKEERLPWKTETCSLTLRTN